MIQEEQRAFSAIWKSEQRGGHFEVASSSRGARVFLVLGKEFFFSCGGGTLGWSLEDIWGETFRGERAVRKPTHLEKEERPQVWILWIFPLRFNLSVFSSLSLLTIGCYLLNGNRSPMPYVHLSWALEWFDGVIACSGSLFIWFLLKINLVLFQIPHEIPVSISWF